MLQIKEQSVPEGFEAPTELELCRRFWENLNVTFEDLDMVQNLPQATLFIWRRLILNQQPFESKDKSRRKNYWMRLFQFETLMHKFVSSQVSMSPQQFEPATMFSMPPPTHNIWIMICLFICFKCWDIYFCLRIGLT